MYRRILFILITPLVAVFAFSAPALALGVAPGTYFPTSDSFDSANAPGSSHLASGTVQCIVDNNLNVTCSGYTLGGVGHTNADVSLVASYSATIDCYNHGTNKNNPIESHTTTFSDSSDANVTSSKNGQLRVPSQSVSAFSAPQVCPNPNWTPQIRQGTLVLNSFTYTLTFADFANPYITIKKP